jgi:hypothetical protein
VRGRAGSGRRCSSCRQWADAVFVDEDVERLLIGQVLAHPERLAELTITDEYFNSSRRKIFRLISHRAKAGLPIDLDSLSPELSTDGLLTLALVCEEEWSDVPHSLRGLERDLHMRWRRRRMNLCGEMLLAVRDPQVDLVPLGQRVVAELQALLPEVRTQTSSAGL